MCVCCMYVYTDPSEQVLYLQFANEIKSNYLEGKHSWRINHYNILIESFKGKHHYIELLKGQLYTHFSFVFCYK